MSYGTVVSNFGPKTDIIYLLVVDENVYARGPERILYLLVLDENGYAGGRKRFCPWT
jgi:hypothetical protein